MGFNKSAVSVSILLASLLASAGCATVQSASKTGRSAPPPAVAPSAADSKAGTSPNKSPQSTGANTAGPVESQASAPASSQVDEAIHEARAHYDLGVAYYERGDVEEARASFDRAIEALTTGPKGAREDARLADAYAELLRQIQEIEAASYHEGAGLSPEEPAPIDLLDQIEPAISPEEAARERALVRGSSTSTNPPVVVNDRVLAWIGAYQGRLHDWFQDALTRSGRYIDMLRTTFREEGMPEDLIYMVHVESAFKPHAYSRARAKGLWQFISGTGSRYGLRRNHWIDERSDPELSTRAAAAYLKDLHEMFGDWYLAMAAYNAGEGKIQRAMNRTGAKDFWALANTSSIRLETKNYVPAILAAILISKDPEKYGFQSQKDSPLQWEAVQIDSATDLGVIARLAEVTIDELKLLNPALTRLMTPPSYPEFELNLPVGRGQAFATAFAALPAAERIPWKEHKVRKGETLAAISRRYGVSVASIRAANSLGTSSTLHAGTHLQIPTYTAAPSGGHGDLTRASSRSRSGGSGTRVVVKVRNGDTLTSIASRYRTSVANIKKWNRLTSSRIRVGDRLVVYTGSRGATSKGSSKSTLASTPSGAGGSSRPESTTYRVRKGDTLYGIASRLSTTVEQICRMNNLSAADPLRPGTLLKIAR